MTLGLLLLLLHLLLCALVFLGIVLDALRVRMEVMPVVLFALLLKSSSASLAVSAAFSSFPSSMFSSSSLMSSAVCGSGASIISSGFRCSLPRGSVMRNWLPSFQSASSSVLLLAAVMVP